MKQKFYLSILLLVIGMFVFTKIDSATYKLGLEDTQDCAGVLGGSASYDECGVCSGGTTGIDPCVIVEAEDFYSQLEGKVANNNAGFTGTGFINTDNDSSTGATYSIVSPDNDLEAELYVRYAMGETPSRPGYVMVNNEIQDTLDMEQTGDDWHYWDYDTVKVKLRAGMNDLRFESYGDKGMGNIDHLRWGASTGLMALTDAQVLEADENCHLDGSVNTNNPGYTGNGFVNTDNDTAAVVAWMVLADEAIETDLFVRYVMGEDPPRPGYVIINNVIQDTLDMEQTGDNWSAWEYDTVSVSLSEGLNEIKFEAYGSKGMGNIDHVLVPMSGVNEIKCVNIMQAEGNYCKLDGTDLPDNPGYTGIGFVNTDNAEAKAVSYAINSETDQSVDLTVRFATKYPEYRSADVYVNGILQEDSLVCTSTGSWSVWETEILTVDLKAGANFIEIVSLTNSGLANIDAFYWDATGLSVGECVFDCNNDFHGEAVIDSCENCVGGDTGAESCIKDCNGDWGGSAEIDPECNLCIGGDTGIEGCPSALNPVDLNAVKAYPIPVMETLFLENAEGSTIIIYNSQGKKLVSKEIFNHIAEVDMSAYANGIYVVVVTTSAGDVETLHIIKH